MANAEDRARQADFPHDDLLHVTAAAEQRIDNGQRRQPHRPGAERGQRQQHHQGDKRGGHDCPSARAWLCDHHVALNPA